ncbi:DUF2490 domain-containing protein [Flavobacterium psychroterrae]|uniref:DUF2490 domain-containing protein n=1 Tax=Flavobacterium psychroterrae TaxID=2133767 RepID=A0ABS5PI50_9FLAO|nr:DUF2490 domain-containing protein [Flavobacterium psychroterrae]MBS7233998.1 DUF2490 domain-containing protein [Flavobacterium psychroterrae]
MHLEKRNHFKVGRIFNYKIYYILLIIGNSQIHAQTDKLNQFWNEYDFTKDLSQKWVLQLDAGYVTSSTPENSDIFHNITQFYIRGWAHYYPSERWKVSVFYAYYSNQNVPELNQRKAPEFRTAFQATYNLVKSPQIKVNLRGRIEDRHIENDDHYLEAVERFRLQIKAVCPITTLGMKSKAIYLFASDELFFKTKSLVSGPDLFDRNRASLGIGFAMMENIQIEAAYANEIMPREPTNKMVNAIQLKAIFNNFLPTIIKSFERKKNAVDQGEGNL